MTRRATILGLLFVSQLAVGCCWARCGPGWRLHRRCAPACDGPAVVPSYSAPLAGPLVGPPGGPGCTSCSTPIAPPPDMLGAAPGPFFGPGPGPLGPGSPPFAGVPQPLGGPTVEPGVAPKH